MAKVLPDLSQTQTKPAAPAASRTATPRGTVIGSNCVVAMEGKTLVIRIDTSVKGHPSKSQKNMLVASTYGNKQVPGSGDTLSVNFYRPPTV